MIPPATKRNINRIIPFGVIWLVFTIVYLLLEKGLLGQLDQYPSTGNPYNFRDNLFITSVFATLSGLALGMVEILYLNIIFQKKSLAAKISYKTTIYVLVLLLFLIGNTIISNMVRLHLGVFDEQVWKNVWTFFNSFAFLSVEIYVAMIIGLSLFYSEVSENLGQGVLRNFFTGKYHSPTEEERVFMFLDMKSSTTIAEKLGHVKYFELLKQYYAALSNPIVNHYGEIYQYVGDEVVVSWKLKKGLKNNNCIQCFFAMKESLEKQVRRLQVSYGVAPTFKAGIHYGLVTTGEIGVLKKEIIFTGDVLNTTARIQSMCNTYQTDILISGQLLQKLSLDTEYHIRELGETQLRGKDEKIQLFTLRKT
ncbi:MAG: adenylate/guanylate cyclase domain-containing protein [Cyclobacteriaceae bacterium]